MGSCVTLITPFMLLEVIYNQNKQHTTQKMWFYINPIQDWPFWGCSRMGEPKRPPLPKISHTYPRMMKLGKVIPYLKKIKKIYESRNTPLEFC